MPGQKYEIAASESQSVKLLSAAAKEEGVWLIGGKWIPTLHPSAMLSVEGPGSIPEREAGTGKLFNTATVYSPEGDPLKAA